MLLLVITQIHLLLHLKSSDSPSDITGNVMSLYSDYYAPEVERGAVEQHGSNYMGCFWGPSETGEVDLGGDMVRYYTSSYTGIDVHLLIYHLMI